MRYQYAVQLVSLAVYGDELDPATSHIARVAPHLGAKEISRLHQIVRREGRCLFASPPLFARHGHQVLELTLDARFTRLAWIEPARLRQQPDEEAHSPRHLFAQRAVLHALYYWGGLLSDGAREWTPAHGRLTGSMSVIAPQPRSNGAANCADGSEKDPSAARADSPRRASSLPSP